MFVSLETEAGLAVAQLEVSMLLPQSTHGSIDVNVYLGELLGGNPDVPNAIEGRRRSSGGCPEEPHENINVSVDRRGRRRHRVRLNRDEKKRKLKNENERICSEKVKKCS
jgi:hypothetical protein